MTTTSLADAFVEELRDVLHAEKQIIKALPRMAKNAEHDDLKAAFEEHLRQTEQQVRRVEQAFESIDEKPRTKRCLGMEGLISEGKEILNADAEPDAADAMMIAAAQKVEHYEIASYGTLCTWAEMLGYDRAAELLKQNLAEEKATDQKLTNLASTINQEAQYAAAE